MFKNTEEFQAAPFETLYLSPSWLPEERLSQNIIFGSTEKNVLSLVLMIYYKDHPSKYAQMWFTRDEVDIMIDRLNEMKTRWDNWEKFEPKDE